MGGFPIASGSKFLYNGRKPTYALKGFIFMEIEGTYTLQAPTEDVWNCLMDGRTVQRAVPGLERLTSIDEHSYTFTLHIRQAPLRGTYTGKASVLEPVYPASYRLAIEGEGPGGKFHSECAVQLSAQNQNTVVSYQGALHFERGHTLIPAPLVKATIRVLLQHFFTALTDQLRTERDGPIYVTTLEEMYEGPFMEEQTSEQLRIPHQESLTPLHRFVRLLRLGHQNPDLEEQWTRRLRQVGLVAALLLLVWLGTRLPRRS